MATALPAVAVPPLLVIGKIPDRPQIGGLIAAGVVAGALLIGGFGAWASFAPLTSAAVTSGTVKVDTNRKTVQHLDGGIIQEIRVREGDVVREGQVLMVLDNVEADADRNALRGQMDAFAAREARLIAQRDGLPKIPFSTDLLARKQDPQMREILGGQERIFTDQARLWSNQIEIWTQRAAQLKAQVGVLQSQIATTSRQLPSLVEELKDAQQLFEQGYSTKPKVLGIERMVEAARGDIAANQNRIAALKEQIAEGEVQKEGILKAAAKSISEELREVQAKRAELDEMQRKADAKAARNEVAAPQHGVVMNLKFFTVGGVVPPRAAILDLVPAQEKLVIEAKVQPLDIDVIRPGLTASVRLIAFKQRTTPVLQGKVTRVSADAITEERSGTMYYVATVEIDAEELAQLPNIKLYPGMPTEVAIVTGERTLLDYLVQPVTDSFARAFQEE